jgi:monoamine oxidase
LTIVFYARYTAILPPGVQTSLGEALDKPCWDNTLHWAATETSFEWVGYVEGALCAGEVHKRRKKEGKKESKKKREN